MLWTSPARADELSVEQVARVQAELDKARKAVASKYGERPSSELTNDERRQYIADERAAIATVFEQLEVDPKAFGIQELRMSNAQREAVKTQKEALVAREEEAARKEASPEEPPPPTEVEVIRGHSEENPVELYRDDTAVEVERPDEDGMIRQPGGDTAVTP